MREREKEPPKKKREKRGRQTQREADEHKRGKEPVEQQADMTLRS